MNVLNLFVKLYSELQNYSGVSLWMMRPLRRAVRSIAWKFVPPYLKRARPLEQFPVIPIVVSFTSFPDRIEYVWQVIECMFRQTYQPEKIILWLSKEQFSDMSAIPNSLRCRMNDIFEIRLVEGDVRSHKKYLYVSKEYPDKYVFLIDDDLYYATDLLERTWEEHLVHPDDIICNYGYLMTFTSDGFIKPYKEWIRNYRYSTSNDLFFGSGGGTLFMPQKMYNDITNIDLALRLTPLADDVWLNTMAKLSGYKIVMLKNGMILPYRIKHKHKLSSNNIEDGMNDKQIQSIMKYYVNHPFKR